MFIAKELIAKGLLATAATATAITLAVVYGDNIAKYMSSEDEGKLIGEVGLECNATTNICNLKSGATGLNVKLSDNSKEVNKTLSTTAAGAGKIKKIVQEGRKVLKFVIEGGDITLTPPATGVEGSNTTTISKLEEFETYGIEKDGDKYYFSRKTDVNAEIKKALGLPEDEACNLPTDTTTEKTCTLDEAKFKKIKFEGRVEDQINVTGSPTLKISKVDESNNDYGNYKLKFVLASDQRATIATDKVIEANTNTEFKIKVTGATGNQGPRTLSLEKAWSVAELAKKIGVADNACTAETASGTKECNLSTTISVFNNANNYVKEATISTGQKLTFATEQPGYNQGYKFTVGTAIQLTGGTHPTGGTTVENIENGDVSYEIKEQTVGDAKK